MNISSLFLRVLGISTALAAVVPLSAQAQGAAYTQAPTVTLNALAASESCGLFATCAGTKQGLGEGDFLVRVSALGVLPQDMSSRVGVIGGRVSATNQVMPELTFEYFFTDHISLDLIAASTRHNLAVQDSILGKVDLGSAWVLPPTLTAAWHFMPHHRFNPYVGVGMTLAFFYNMQPAGGAVQKLDLRTTVGPAANVGFDYQVAGNWFVNVDAKQMFLSVPAYINERGGGVGPFIHARDSLNPTTVAAGIEYRF